MLCPSDLFDAAEAERRKEAGIAVACAGRAPILDHAQEIAYRLARWHNTVSMDMVAAELAAEGIDPAALGNAAGAVFKGGAWECTGFIKSVRASTHGRAIRTWRLKETP